MSEPRTAFYTNESFQSRDTGEFLVAEIVENEAGWTPASSHPDVASSQAEADRRNAQSGLSKDDVLAIVASSFRQGAVTP